MTVSSTSSRVVYAGNGMTTNWPFAFKVQQAADLAVVYTDATGADFPLSPSQYTASGLGLDAGGSVTYPLSGAPIATGTKLTIYRNVALVQPTAISNQGAMWPQVIEAALDRLTYMAQAVSDAVSRALVISPTDSATFNTLPNATQRANSVLGFDGSGQPYAAQLVAGLGAASAWLVANFFPMASALAARGSLGAAGTADNNTFGGNNSFVGTNDFTAGRAKVPTRAAADNGSDAASTAYADRAAARAVFRSYLAGLALSAAGGTGTFGVAAGIAADTTAASMLTLASAFSKTTGAWAVGTGNGGLDTGSIANSTWYHVYLIQRPDTLLVDVIFSTSASAPTLPAGYTLYRRIGAMKTDGAARWLAFVQDGDYFRWKASVLDVADTNPGTAAVLKTLSVPPGVNVQAMLNVAPVFGSSGAAILYVADPAANDEAPSAAAAPLGNMAAVSAGGGLTVSNQNLIRTNTSAQIRYRLSASGASDTVYLATLGWIDRRGRDT